MTKRILTIPPLIFLRITTKSAMKSILSKLDFRVNAAYKTELGKNWNSDKFGTWGYTPFSRLYLPLEGEGILETENKIIPLKRGKIVLIYPSALIHVRCDHRLVKYWTHFNVFIRDTGIDIFSMKKEIMELPVEESKIPFLCNLFEHLSCRYAEKRALSTVDELEETSSLGLLLTPFLRQLSMQNEESDCFRLLDLAAYMYKNMNQPLNLKMLGQYANLNPNYLSRIFRQFASIPPMTYLTQIRIQCAMAELQRNELRINEIAEKVGIPIPSVFCRLFKQIVGISPREYRKQGISSHTIV